jgi:hypothetical protein
LGAIKGYFFCNFFTRQQELLEWLGGTKLFLILS